MTGRLPAPGVTRQAGLRLGKPPLEVLERLFRACDIRDPRVIVGPRVGEDAAVLDLGDRYLVAKVDPITFVAEEIGWYAVHINANDIACMGAKPAWFLATVLLPQGASQSLAEGIFDQILDDYFVMYRDVHHVHGDLSEYNILWWQEQPWIIDVPQAYKVDTHCNMKCAESMLRKDLQNICSHFESYGINRDPEQILQLFLEAYIPHNLRNYRESIGGDMVEE
jgi:hypothetical protein